MLAVLALGMVSFSLDGQCTIIQLTTTNIALGALH